MTAPRTGSSLTVLITGASSGIGAITARELAAAGHIVYAGMRRLTTRNAAAAEAATAYAAQRQVQLIPLELDVTDQESVDAAIDEATGEAGDLDVVIHNAGHMVLGPAEAFSPEELSSLYDTNVLGTQRVNRAVLPHLRCRGRGLIVWVGSSSTRGGTPPFLGPYFAARAAMDSLAVGYAAELIRFGIETTIIVPGPFTGGTNHFQNSGRPSDMARAAAYDELYGAVQQEIPKRLADLEPPGADVGEVARAIATVLATPTGHRPFRVHVDPTNDGAEVVSAAADRMRVEFYRRGVDRFAGGRTQPVSDRPPSRSPLSSRRPPASGRVPARQSTPPSQNMFSKGHTP